MKAFIALMLTLSASAAAAQGQRYSASGSEPFWSLDIGGGRIVVRTGQGEGDHVFPAVRSRLVDGARLWRASSRTETVRIEARRRECTDEGNNIHEHEVRVRLPEIELNGCGGRVLQRGDD
jgi:uncharacterized membrane protein